MKTLSEFIDLERKSFRVEDNNLFAFSLGQIDRYYEFLCIIDARQQDASQQFVRNSEALRAAIPSGTPSLTDEQKRLLDEGRTLTTLLHLEIESFYLFAMLAITQKRIFPNIRRGLCLPPTSVSGTNKPCFSN